MLYISNGGAEKMSEKQQIHLYDWTKFIIYTFDIASPPIYTVYTSKMKFCCDC